MRPSRRRRAGWLVVAVVVAAIVWAGRVRPGDGSLPAQLTQRLVEVPLRAISGAVRGAVETVAEPLRREALHERVHQLEARVAELETANAVLAEASRENQRLGELLRMAEREHLSGRAARVITSGRRPRTVVIDRGERDGVQVDAAVVAAGGLAGRVYQTGDRTALVQLTVDSASGLGGLLARTSLQGVVVGVGDGLRLRYVPTIEDVVIGDQVLTSGLDRVYPKGLVVGRVTEVSAGADAFHEIVVAPAVALRRLETVLVLDARAEASATAGNAISGSGTATPAPGGAAVSQLRGARR